METHSNEGKQRGVHGREQQTSKSRAVEEIAAPLGAEPPQPQQAGLENEMDGTSATFPNSWQLAVESAVIVDDRTVVDHSRPAVDHSSRAQHARCTAAPTAAQTALPRASVHVLWRLNACSTHSVPRWCRNYLSQSQATFCTVAGSHCSQRGALPSACRCAAASACPTTP